MDKAQYILHTRDLSIGYKQGMKQEEIFTDLNLKASPGQLHCLLGVNGIGKSTLLRTLAALQSPLAGEVLIDNSSIDSYNQEKIAKYIAVVLTNQGIHATLSVKELVEMGRYPYTNWLGRLGEQDKQKVEEAIKLCDIAAIAHKNIHTISDGQLQKTLIARALAQDCPFMILDEPTNHLDPNNRYIIIELLRKIAHESNICVIMSTHQVEMALQLADTIWLAKEDSIEVNSPQEMLKTGSIQRIFKYLSLSNNY